MSGLLSRTPAPSSIRLLVGGYVLLLVEAGLVVGATTIIGTIPCVIVAGSALAALAALLLAILGKPEEARATERHHAR